MTERTYTPHVGDKVKLRTWSDYVDRGLNPWTHLTVVADATKAAHPCLVVQTDRDKQSDAQTELSIPLDCIDMPIGWQPRYTITVTADKAEQVLGWFRDKRGITVHQSHYMPSCPTAFAPADNHGTGDWRFNGADSETIAADRCDELFRVVRLDTVYDAMAPAEWDKVCEYCHGTGKFIAPKHALAAGQSLDCTCQNGKRPTYLVGMEPKLRKQAIKALEARGWKVWYQRSGQLWRMERETVIKEFGCPVPSAEVDK